MTRGSVRHESSLGRLATVSILRTPLGRHVKVIDYGAGTPVLFLPSGVGSAGEWKPVFSLLPGSYRLVAIEACQGGSGLGVPGRRNLDDYADQVYAVAEHLGTSFCLVGFSWGAATAARVAAAARHLVESRAVIEPEAYAHLRTQDTDGYAQICGLRDRWRAHARVGRWYDACEEFIDFYNGRGAFAQWPPARRQACLAGQQERGDLWDVLFDERLLTFEALATVTAPVHVIEGSETSAVDHAFCAVVRRHLPHAQHTLIEGAGHMVPLTHPELLTRALLTGIARHALPPRTAGGRRDDTAARSCCRRRRGGRRSSSVSRSATATPPAGAGRRANQSRPTRTSRGGLTWRAPARLRRSPGRSPGLGGP